MIKLYAMPKGATEKRKEWLITSCATHGMVEQLKCQLRKAGWHSFRVSSGFGVLA